MESYVVYKFAARREFEHQGQKFNRLYQFEMLPGSPWEEIFSALDETAEHFSKMQAEAKAKEDADKKAQEDLAAQEAAQPIDAEVVNTQPVEAEAA